MSVLWQNVLKSSQTNLAANTKSHVVFAFDSILEIKLIDRLWESLTLKWTWVVGNPRSNSWVLQGNSQLRLSNSWTRIPYLFCHWKFGCLSCEWVEICLSLLIIQWWGVVESESSQLGSRLISLPDNLLPRSFGAGFPAIVFFGKLI